MVIKELILEAEYKIVLQRLHQYYADIININDYSFSLLYERLKMLEFTENNNNMSICISVFKKSNSNLEHFSEYDECKTDFPIEQLYFDVCVTEDGFDLAYSPSALEHSEFLSCHINDETLQKFTKESLLAHFLNVYL